MKEARFRAGDRVRIRPRSAIEEDLLSSTRAIGCFNTRQLLDHCGEEYVVLRVVRNVFDERTLKMHRMSSFFYILEGLLCDGDVPDFEHRCDRSCPLFWREDWLVPAAADHSHESPDHHNPQTESPWPASSNISAH